MVLRRQNGFSLVEVLVAIGIISVILLVASGVMQSMTELKTRVAKVAGLFGVPTEIRECINDEESWRATIADPANPSMACLRNRRPCNPATIAAGPNYIKVMRSVLVNGTRTAIPCVPGYTTLPGVDTSGFTKDGAVCTGFATAGNDQCPFRYNVRWSATCAGGQATCMNPVIRINGNMNVGTADTRNGVTAALRRYAMSAVRGRADTVRYFTLEERRPTGQIVDTGFCNMTGAHRKFTNLFDPGGFVIGFDPAQGTFTLIPGNYACRISVPVNLGRLHKSTLVNVSTGSTLLNGTSEYAPDFSGYVQTRSEIRGILTFRNPATLAVRTYCRGNGPSDPAFRDKMLGMPASQPGHEELYSVIQCTALAQVN